MICRLAALVMCLQLSNACVPVRPGEDMPCPSVPLAPSATGFLTSGLKMKTVNGAQVFYCNAPEMMISVDGSTVTPLTSATTIECKPNSAMFTLDGKNVGSKKFTCGEVLVPCPTITKYTGPDLPGPPPIKIGTLNGPTTAANGDVTYSCTAPNRLYRGLAGQPTSNNIYAPGSTVGCKRQTGVVSIAENGVDLGPSDPTMFEFFCGANPCQTCDQNLIIDQANGACPTQAGIFCTAKPMVMNDAATMCPVVSCTGTDQLYLLTSTTASTAADMVACKDGNWVTGAAMDPLPAGAIGFVCGKAADCTGCNAAVDAVFDVSGAIRDPAMLAKPVCNYKCDPAAQLVYDGMAHDSAICQIDTEKITIDTPTGATPTATMKFSCQTCNCMTDHFNEGQAGLCPVFELCAKPVAGTTCESSCPTGSTALARDINGASVMGGAAIKCIGSDWVTAMSDGSGVTCIFPAGAGTSPSVPNVPNQCNWGIKTCPAGNCDPSLIVYVLSGDGYKATCKTGFMTSEMGGLDNMNGDVTCYGGISAPVADNINCIKDGDPDTVTECLAMLTPAQMGLLKHECKNGACFFSCATGGQQLSYMMNGAPTMSQYLRCNAEILAVNGIDFPDIPTITCV